MKLCMKREYIIPISLGLLAFLIRFYPHGFVIPYIGKEEGGLIMYSQRIVDGDFRFVRNLPHVSIVSVAILHILTRFPITMCAFVWNPLMGALSTIVFYYILKNVLDVSEPWTGTLLFVFLDSHIYRTTIFGSSSEGTAIFVLLLFVYSYFHVNKIVSLVLLVIIPWIHIIVFGVGMLFVVVDQFFIKQRITTKKSILLLSVVGIVILFFLYVLPYRFVVLDVAVRFRLLSLNQLLEVLKTRMFPILFTTLLGTCILFCVSAYYFIRKRNLVSYVFVLIIPILTVLTLLSSSHMSPYRMLPFVGIIGIMSFSLLNVKWKKLVVVGLVLVMVFQVTFYGWDINNHIHDGVTLEEVKMVEWLKKRNPECVHYNVLWDDSGKQLLLYKMPIDYYNPPDREGRQKDWELFMQLKEQLVNGTLLIGYESSINYIMYSDRFASQAFIVSQQEHGQILYGHYEIEDMWANSTLWKVIYDDEGGRIYERVQ